MFRCVNPRCVREDDIEYAEARGSRPVPMARAFKTTRNQIMSRFTKQVPRSECDKCGKETTKRICPHCHQELSYDAGLIDDHIIAIIGARATGKGHYLATLINRLQHEVGRQFGFSLRMLGDATIERFENDYRQPLFDRKTTLNLTMSAQVDIKVKTPMVFRLTFANKAVNLSFFDSAGEDMSSLSIMEPEAKYICHSAGIIFLLDPLQIDAVRHQLPQECLPPLAGGAKPDHIVERLRELFERQPGRLVTSKVKTPVAFTLTKVDVLSPILHPGSALFRTGEHFGHLNLSDSQSVHTEVWNYLQTWMGSGMDSMVEKAFERYRYFGVSSLGRSPDQDGHVESVSPIRVEDPFLWLLHELDLIQGRKDKK